MIDEVIKAMTELAEPARFVNYSIEDWNREFGESMEISTPLGIVKLGDRQFEKMGEKKRQNEVGYIRPTLETPDLILEKEDETEGVERNYKYLFIKTFLKADGIRVVHFESVTILKNHREISISSHEVYEKAIRKEILNNKVKYLSKKFGNLQL